MPVSAIIPIVEDYREVILPAGYADQIRHSLLIGDYLYYFCGFPLGQMLKINKNDFSDRTVLTFPNDNKHRVPLEMCHTGGVLYCLFRNVDTNDVPNFKFTIGRVQTDPFAILSDFVDVSATYIVQNGSITTDGTSLYVIVGTATLYATRKILKYAISGGAPTVADVTGFGSCHCIRYSGGKLYLTGADFPGATFAYEAHAARMTTGLVIEQTATWEVTDGEFSENEFGISADHIWVSDRSLRGIVKKFQKSNLTIVTDLPTGQLARSTQMTNDGRDLWVLFENGRGVRFNPSSNAQAIYALNDGQGFQSELVGDGTYLWTGWNQDATKIARYHIPAEQVAAQRFGSTGYDDGRAVARDANGNIYLTGLFQRTVAFGSTSLTSYQNPQTQAYATDIFVAKLNADGSVAWAVKASTTNSTAQNEKSSRSIAVDSAGNVWVTGYFQGTVDFGGTSKTSVGGNDIFLAKYSGTDGSLLYVERYGDTGDDKGLGVVVDGSDNVIMTGSFSTGADLDGVSFGGPKLKPAITDGFVAKYNSSGTWLNSIQAAGNSTVSPGGIAVDSDDNLWVHGSFRGTMNFGGGQLDPTSEFTALYLVKLFPSLAADGPGMRFGNAFGAQGLAVACDSDDNVVATGQVKGGMNFGGGVVGGEPQFAGVHSYIVKYNSAKVYQWAIPVAFSSGNTSTGNAIVALPGSNGDIVVAGSFSFTVGFQHNLTLPAVTKTSLGRTDVFIARYTSATGAYASVDHYGSNDPNGSEFCFGLAALAGGIIATGGFVATVNFGTATTPSNLTSEGSGDAFLLPLTF